MPFDPAETDYLAQQNAVGEAIVQAIRESGVQHVVALSSIGAELPADTGVIVSLHEQERRLRQLTGVNVLVLRPGPFFENLTGFVEMARQEGIAGDAFAPDLPLPMIATRDVASAAASALLARDWTGFQIRELLGQRDLTYAEATRILGARIGMPELQYVQFSYSDAARALTQVGFSAEVAELEAELARAANEGRLVFREERNVMNTTATPFEEFAEELARLYAAPTETAS